MQESVIETDLAFFLSKYTGSVVDFYRFPGNYGDSIIFHGTQNLLDSLRISINFVELESEVSNSILIIDGGGNFVEQYTDVFTFLANKYTKYDKIIILPHTINGRKAKELIEKFNSNITIFAREKITYANLKEINTSAKIYLWHDCAFYNNFKDYIKPGSGVLNAFRTDVESKNRKLPDNNEDISYDGWAMKPINGFVEKISKYNIVRTDRLHVAITATLLGKNVELYQNSYYKNEAVYNYSLKKYKNVSFIYD